MEENLVALVEVVRDGAWSCRKNMDDNDTAGKMRRYNQEMINTKGMRSA